jgi:putative DNA primase/helicase
MQISVDTFREAMRRISVEPPSEIIADGKLHRFYVHGDKPKSLNGWYILHGDDPPAGQFGCWKRGISESWCAKEYRTLTPEEKARYAANMGAAKKAREAELAKIQADCRKWCADAWEKCRDATNERPYLVRKRVNAYGLRLLREMLLVPVQDMAGTIHGLQFIQNDGSKRFKTGTAKEGHFYPIGEMTDDIAVICEGYATGASIYQATGHMVFIAFDAGNLLSVSREVRKKYPEARIILAADNDQFTEGNPGLSSATEAAKMVNGLLAVPSFKDISTKPTDFNDLSNLEGAERVREIIEAATNPTTPTIQADEGQSEETLRETVSRLAKLDPLEYEQVRKAEAKRLGIERIGELDKTVKAARKAATESNNDIFPLYDSWDNPVGGRELVAELAATYERFSVLPQGSAITAALWTVLTYCFDNWNTLPILTGVSEQPS